jgi:hypothetical protein
MNSQQTRSFAAYRFQEENEFLPGGAGLGVSAGIYSVAEQRFIEANTLLPSGSLAPRYRVSASEWRRFLAANGVPAGAENQPVRQWHGGDLTAR